MPGIFPTQLTQTVGKFNHELNLLGARYVLVYADVVNAAGQMQVRLASNYDQDAIPGLLGSLLEPGPQLKEMLTELFRAHPLRITVPADPENPPAPDATPVLVDVPTEKAVEMVCATLLTNLQLRGAKQPSPIIMVE